ncbi:hypothetical protein H2200_008278 [Cladophialophora chaetospira]|uniref:DUF1996 domain-containing protein n=1 Tax=Cladophialophora chaetospira TaxID=386627 RepID=A0AA38X5Y3_9EURO|nr:hypothetical protein H2200_008278 [Cladophialophora chaetospira]
MLTGDSRVRAYDSNTLTYLNTRPVADRVSFRCIDDANDIPEQHYMFRTDCTNGMRAQVNFQSCWDGINLYLDGNAHVDYLSGIDYGVCPPSHPVPIPGLFFEVLYMTNSIDQSAGGQFVFANGDATGYGFHGDFVNGWDQGVQTQAVQNCLYTDNGGVISACSALVPSDDVNFPRTCPEQPSVFDEPVHGMLSALPGCNPITSGPDLAPQVVCPLNSHTPDTSSSSASSLGATSSSSTPSSTTAAITTSTASASEITVSTDSTPTSSDSVSLVTVTLFNSPSSLPSTSDNPISSTAADTSSQTTTGPLESSSSIPTELVTVTVPVGGDFSTTSDGAGSATTIFPTTQQSFFPGITFTTITTTALSAVDNDNFSAVPTMIEASAAFCSSYANLSLPGCPVTTPAASSTTLLPAEVVTTYVTVTQSSETFTASSDATSSESSTTATAATFRIRGRQVVFTER